ncbi:MAG TPA: T9SS type A sorting domain-containing protein [Candidatus Marinimicrobia bacterium]|nr:T9SS type A sorting domain-containing protein [Candidatus Neomarinimicrobiota bacterium]HQO74981.1 T9SS type A sorting domain-containing protein [Candidatus Neomarinimicrobiota bacterium]
MKKSPAILILFWATVGLANPIAAQLFSELYFDSTGWKIEVMGDWYGENNERIVIVSLTDSAVTDTSFHLSGEFPVITPADMETDFYINPAGDYLKIGILNEYGLYFFNNLIFGENGVIAAPRAGESIAFGGFIEASELMYYLDNTPTLGAINDCGNSKGTIQGIVTDSSGMPIPDVKVKYSVTCSSESEDMSAVTDANGRFEFECLTAQQIFSFQHDHYEFLKVPVQIWPDSTIEKTFVLTAFPPNYQNYFPLQDGNYWNYYSYIEDSYSEHISINISATILINDKTYYLMGNDTIGYDSLKNVVIYKNQRDSLLYPLSLSDGNSMITPDSLWMMKLNYDQTPITVRVGTFTDNIIVEKTFIGVRKSGLPPDTILTYFSKNVGIIKNINICHSLISKSVERKELYHAYVNGTLYYENFYQVEQSFTPIKYNLSLTNYPNPFNSSTTIKYHLAETGDVRLSVFDLSGRLVAELFKGRQPAGDYHYLWSGDNLPSGVYLLSLQAGGKRVIQKCLLMK